MQRSPQHHKDMPDKVHPLGVLHKWTRDNFDLAPEVIAEILTQIFLAGMLPLLS